MKDIKVEFVEGKVCQVGIAVWDIDEAVERFSRELGYGPWKIWTFETPELKDFMYRGVMLDHAAFKVAICNAGPTELELAQPIHGLSIYDEFLESTGEGIHHMKLYYKDVPKAIEMYKEQGYYVIQSGRFKNDQHAYLGTEDEYGLIWELGNQGSIGEPDEVYSL